jgi:hypothetical protein
MEAIGAIALLGAEKGAQRRDCRCSTIEISAPDVQLLGGQGAR